jgi:uncharacterized membrane protein YdjX (TVP38/TMEM64 family)
MPWILRAFFTRLRDKLLPMIPVLLIAAAVFGVAWILTMLITPFLPERWQVILTLLQDGDWHTARDKLREALESSVLAVELAFILLQALQVIIAPIPGQLAGLLGGYLFGFWKGLTLTMLGLTLGSLAAMLLGRAFGEQVVRRFVPADLMGKLDTLISQGGLWNFFVIFLLPALPDDAVCFVAGLTRLRIWQLIAVMFLGRLPGMAVLCYVGQSAAEDVGAGSIVFGIAMAISAVAWFFSEELEARLFGKKPDAAASDSQSAVDELK